MLPGRILMLTGGTDTPVITLDGDLGIITASTFTGPLDQTNIFTTGVTAGQGIFVGTGDEGWQQAVFDAEENAWGNGYLAGNGSFSGGRFQNATDSWVASNLGSFSGGNFSEAVNSYASSVSGSFSGGSFSSSSGSYAYSGNGSFSGGYFALSTNSYAQSAYGSFSGGDFDSSIGSFVNSSGGSFSGGGFGSSSGSYVSSYTGSFSGGYFGSSSGSYAASGNGSFSGGYFGSSSGSYAASGNGSFSGGNFDSSENVALTVNGGLGYLSASVKTNISVTLDNGSLVVGNPPSEYTGAFDNEIALLSPSGKVFGVDSSGNATLSGSLSATGGYGSDGVNFTYGVVASVTTNWTHLIVEGGTNFYNGVLLASAPVGVYECSIYNAVTNYTAAGAVSAYPSFSSLGQSRSSDRVGLTVSGATSHSSGQVTFRLDASGDINWAMAVSDSATLDAAGMVTYVLKRLK